MKSYEAIVLGMGGVGSATAYHLARRGARVLGIDRFAPPHDRGSSHGHTRVIRQAYFEHADYVPLAQSAFRLWRQLEQQVGQQLLFEIGLLQAGPAGGEVAEGVLASARRHGLDIESIKAADADRRFAPLRFQQEHIVLLERASGYLLVERCVQAHLEAATQAGAQLVFGSRVLDWTAEADLVTVKTETESFAAQRLIFALGAGAPPMLRLPAFPLQVTRKHVYWYHADAATHAAMRQSPIFLYETDRGVFYGFPPVGDRGIKICRHSGGTVIDGDPFVSPSDVDGEDRADDEELVERFLQAVLPGARLTLGHHATCLYTMTSDGHFRVGPHPALPNVFLAAGLSGHGFKFTPILGEALAELASDGQTRHPIDFLSVK